MPEDISDRMPQDLPATKRIDVMVGITQSKVIVFFPGVPNSMTHSLGSGTKTGTSSVLEQVAKDGATCGGCAWVYLTQELLLGERLAECLSSLAAGPPFTCAHQPKISIFISH